MHQLRPTSVSIIGWVLTGLGLTSIATLITLLVMPGSLRAAEPMGMQPAEVLLLGVWAVMVALGSGIGLLRGACWARWLLLLGWPGLAIANWFLHGFEAVWVSSLLMWLGVMVLLHRPAASAYLRGERVIETAAMPSRVPRFRRTAGVLLLMFGALLLVSQGMMLPILLAKPAGLLAGLAMLAIALAVIAAGVLTWGGPRRTDTWLTTLCGAGCMALLMATNLGLYPWSRSYAQVAALIPPQRCLEMALGLGLLGVLLLVPTARLLARRHDVEKILTEIRLAPPQQKTCLGCGATHSASQCPACGSHGFVVSARAAASS